MSSISLKPQMEEFSKARALAFRQTAQRGCCFLWPDGPALSVARRGVVGGGLPLCFDFLRRLISGLGWEESSRIHMTRGETTRYG